MQLGFKPDYDFPCTVAGQMADNEEQFSLIVVLASTAGGIVGLALIGYLARSFMKRYTEKKSQALQTEVKAIKSKADLFGFRAMKAMVAKSGFYNESDMTGAGISERRDLDHALPTGRSG